MLEISKRNINYATKEGEVHQNQILDLPIVVRLEISGKPAAHGVCGCQREITLALHES